MRLIHVFRGTLGGVKELQTLALGLIIVFVDVSTPDWVADPVGWILVLIALSAVKERLPDYGQVSLAAWVSFALSVVTWPESSVAHLDGWLGLLFSMPVLAFCFLLCDSLRDVSVPDREARFRLLCWGYGLLVAAPVAIYGLDWSWLETPTAVLAVVANVALVLVLFGSSDEDAVLPADGAETDGADRTDERGSGSSPGSSSSEGADTAEDRTNPGKHRA